MFYYNRQIIYLDLMCAGARLRGAGFLKREELGDEIRWQLQVQGVGEEENGFFDIRDETGALVDKILLKHGNGSYLHAFDKNAVSRGGKKYGEICGLRLELPGGRYLEGVWKAGCREPSGSEAQEQSVRKPPEALAQEESKGEGPKKGEASKGEGSKREGPNGEGAKKEERIRFQNANAERLAAAETKEAEKPKAEEPKAEEQKAGEQKEREAEAGRPQGIPERESKTASEQNREPNPEPGQKVEQLYEDKWEQLKQFYQTVHPFGDGREFLSITPRDFVILGREYQKLVHNSFLLHGYYNYRHVILGRYGKGGEENYYLGVPGVFYEREKMAAEMFGFEAFEGQSTPAEAGSFGYYMKKVRL